MTKIPRTTVGRMIKKWCHESGTTQVELSERMQYDLATLRRVVSGDRNCSAGLALKLQLATTIAAETILIAQVHDQLERARNGNPGQSIAN